MKLKRLILSSILMTTLVGRAYVPASASDFNPEVQDSEIATDSDAEVTEEVVVTSSAPENTEKYDEKKGIANVRLMYCADSGAKDIIKSGYAFFVGDENSICLISCCDTVILTDAEKDNVAASHGVERDKVKIEIELVLKSDVIVPLSVVNSSTTMNFAILQPTSSLSSCTTFRLCEDVNGIKNGSEVHSYDSNMQDVVCQIEDWSEIGDAHYFRYTADVELTKGLPLINSEGEVIAIVSSTNKGDPSERYALQIDEVMDVLDVLNIGYNPQIEVDTSELMETVQRYKELDADKYTTATWIICKETYDEAVALLEKIGEGKVTSYTKDEVKDINTRLCENIAALKKIGVSGKTVLRIAIIIGTIMFIIIVVLIVLLITKTKKYKNRIREEEGKSITAKEALKLSGRITPGVVLNSSNHSMPTNRSLGKMGNEGVVSSYGETTVLNTEVDVLVEPSQQTVVSYPTLTRYRNGESVIINQNSFVLGSAFESVDFQIRYNNNISRKHACIMKFADGYYIQDLDTTNGTAVNGVRVESKSYAKLTSGCTIQIADEEFEFRE